MLGRFKLWLGRLLIRFGKRLAPRLPGGSLPIARPNMFDAASRQELEEMLGYERYLLRECGDAVRAGRGTTGPLRIIINDVKPDAMLLSAHDVLGDTGAGMVGKMSPLVLTAACKLLDMVFEWTIEQNGLAAPSRFEEKVRLLRNTPTLQHADFLANDVTLRDSSIGLYQALIPYRNAIIHNRWGRLTDGALDFNFRRAGVTYQLSMSFDVVLVLADVADLLGSMLVEKSSDEHKLDSLRWLLDKIAFLHGCAPFNIRQPRYFQIERRTALPGSGPVVVDLAAAREMMDRQAFGGPVRYDLTVIAEGPSESFTWRIPAVQVPPCDELVLDSAWDGWRVADSA